MGDGFSLYCMRMLPIVLFGYMKKHNTTVLKSFYGHYLFGKLSLMLGELLSSRFHESFAGETHTLRM